MLHLPPPLSLATLSLATLSQHMVYVEGGIFEMGSEEYPNERPIHKVRLNGYYLCRYPVSQQLWKEVMGENPGRVEIRKPPSAGGAGVLG